MSNDCLFCAIVAGDVPNRTVFEDETTLAFLDISPWGTGHTLVIPKRHVESVLADPDGLSLVASQVGTVSRLLVDRLGAQGINVLSNAGAVSGQEVMHLHVHLIPRYADSPGIANIRQSADDDLDEVLRRITG